MLKIDSASSETYKIMAVKYSNATIQQIQQL